MSDPRRLDPFLAKDRPSELRIASEFLTIWLPFLSKGLCGRCNQILSRRVRSVQSPESDTVVEATDGTNNEDSSDFNDTRDHDDKCDSYSLGSWNDDYPDVVNGTSVRGLRIKSSASLRISATEPAHKKIKTSGNHMSWADMAQQEDELGVEESKAKSQLSNGNYSKAASGSLKRKTSFVLRELMGKLLTYLMGSSSIWSFLVGICIST